MIRKIRDNQVVMGHSPKKSEKTPVICVESRNKDIDESGQNAIPMPNPPCVALHGGVREVISPVPHPALHGGRGLEPVDFPLGSALLSTGTLRVDDGAEAVVMATGRRRVAVGEVVTDWEAVSEDGAATGGASLVDVARGMA